MSLPDTLYGISIRGDMLTVFPIYTEFGIEQAKKFDQFIIDYRSMKLLHSEKKIPIKSNSKAYRLGFIAAEDVLQFIKDEFIAVN